MTDKLAFHLMAKPSGPICNLDCKYCFYLEKEAILDRGARYRMSEEVLEAYVRDYIAAQDVPEIHFAWQGGEPTLMGVDFFRRAVALQRKYANGRKIENGFQTNGVLLNEEWAEFLAEHRFLVGISIDGPEELHDHYRVDKGGSPTWGKVMRAIGHLKAAGVDFNTLTVVNALNVRHPRKVYRFLKEIGSCFHQYIPLVERRPDQRAQKLGLTLATPPAPGAAGSSMVTDWSVPSLAWGEFLATIFDEWVRHDVGRVFVNHFENTLAAVAGYQPGMCVYRETCGSAMVVEHNGDVFSCDHYVYPEYRLGNLLRENLRSLVESKQQTDFGDAKAATLPAYCWNCDFVIACHGECPKHRFIQTPTGEPGLNYLCAGLKHYFGHVWPVLQTLAAIIERGGDPAEIMVVPARPRGRP